MSSRSRKSTTTTTVRQVVAGSIESEQGTPAGQSSHRSPGRRPPSPNFVARKQEKEELAHLNTRLATYIDKVRSLESENRSLRTKIVSYEETSTRETSNLKALYEQELADARKNLDAIAIDKAKLEVEVGSLRGETATWKEKYYTTKKQMEDAEQKLLTVEGQVGDLQARLNDAVNQRKHWETEYNRARAEADTLQKKLSTALKQLEEQSVRNVDLSNQVQTLKEDLEFRSQVHAQELNETKTRSQIEIEEVDGSLSRDYENRLSEALINMREENEYSIRIAREESDAIMGQRLEGLKALASQRDTQSSESYEEMRSLRTSNDELNCENTKLKTQLAAAESRIALLEGQLARIHEEHEQAISNRDAEIRRLREELADQLVEYKDLMDVKLSLDMEIASYRKLLESEESRLNIESPRRTPLRATPGTSKRKRQMELYGESGSAYKAVRRKAGFAAKASSKGVVEISETNEEGKYIKLYNTSDKDVALGNWQIKHVASDNETIYKFHRSVHLKPETSVTVWSSDTETTHSPPDGDFVMKGQKWFTSDNMTSTLIDKDEVDVACREMTRFSASEEEEYDGLQSTAGRENGEKCAIM